MSHTLYQKLTILALLLYRTYLPISSAVHHQRCRPSHQCYSALLVLPELCSSAQDRKGVSCVRAYEHWWYKEQSDGLCKKEAWRKNTAIAVPVVVVVLAVAAVLLVFLLKKRGTKGGDKSAKMEGRDQVSTA